MTKSLIATALLGAVLSAQVPNPELGYTDTPRLPGTPYRVHDPARPHPAIVTPGAQAGEAPSDAIVLFGYLFLGGNPPPPPFTSCNRDFTQGGLTCERATCQ